MIEAEILAMVERLMKVESSAPAYHVGPTTNWHRNPDGPEAADVIQSQAARIAELESENARLLNAFDGIVDQPASHGEGGA